VSVVTSYFSHSHEEAVAGWPAADPRTRAADAFAARLAGAVKTYGTGPDAVRALDGVDVAFGTGEFTAVMGPSGSGKSTLLHCIVGLDRLSEGTAIIGETDLGTLNDRELTLLRRKRVGFVFQSFNLIPSLSALENITLPLDLAGRAPDQGFLDELVDTLGLSRRLSNRPSQLVSLWLNSGVPATEVARRAGHGVAVLLKIYAHCIDGQATAANQRIAEALGTGDAEKDLGDEGDGDMEQAS
jgi:ABC-type glutathione transport system ATPase component